MLLIDAMNKGKKCVNSLYLIYSMQTELIVFFC